MERIVLCQYFWNKGILLAKYSRSSHILSCRKKKPYIKMSAIFSSFWPLPTPCQHFWHLMSTVSIQFFTPPPRVVDAFYDWPPSRGHAGNHEEFILVFQRDEFSWLWNKAVVATSSVLYASKWWNILFCLPTIMESYWIRSNKQIT